jgi:hypothetical protein
LTTKQNAADQQNNGNQEKESNHAARISANASNATAPAISQLDPQ